MMHILPFKFQKMYPEVYHKRFPTEESRAAVIPEKTPRLKPPLMFFNIKKPFQPFQRSWSFRAWSSTADSSALQAVHTINLRLHAQALKGWSSVVTRRKVSKSYRLAFFFPFFFFSKSEELKRMMSLKAKVSRSYVLRRKHTVDVAYMSWDKEPCGCSVVLDTSWPLRVNHYD